MVCVDFFRGFPLSRFIIHNHSHARWQQVIMDPGNTSAMASSSRSGSGGGGFFGQGGPCTDPSPPHTSCSNKTWGSVIDDTWIVQSKHGSFDPAKAPTEVPVCTPDTCRQYDHWAPRLSKALPSTHANQTLAMIADFRMRFGEASWLREELRELDVFKHAFRADKQLQFEDTSEDGNSDGHWPGP